MGDRETYDRRRREFAGRLPAHYCEKCSCVGYPEDEACLDCGSPRPGAEWPSIQDGFDPWLGRVLDSRYLITKRIGQGATGSVYRAESLQISREFAVKIVNFKQASAGVDPEQVRSRLQREIEAISRLRNPHVVPFYEVLELFDSFVGIVMDFVDGQTLEEVVYKTGHMNQLRASKILRQIANGIHEAHEAGMIHRDLKPENLMLEIMPAGDDFVHVLDFGIVHLDDGVNMTKGFLGTPLYASPEQAMAGTVDRRSDIYSLGAIFFFLLTGRPPFVSENVYEILRAHVRTVAPRIREIAPKEEFPVELEDLVESMLSKNPTSRPQTLSEVIRRVDHLIHSGSLDRKTKTGGDSIEIDPIHEVKHITGPQRAIARVGVGSDSSESEFHEDSDDPQTGSFIVSDARDKTGPKAAIFKRTGSQPSVRKLIHDSSEEMRRPNFDRILQSDTGVFPVGIQVGETLRLIEPGPDGELVLVDTRDNAYITSRGEAQKVCTRAGVVCALPFENDLILGCENGELIRVNLAGKSRRLFQDVRQASMTSLAVDGKGSLIVAGSDSGRVYICRTADGDDAWSRIQDGPPVTAVAVSHIGNMFAVARKHGETGIYNTSSPRTQFIRFSTLVPVRSIAFSVDGHLIAALLEDDTVALYMVLTGQRVVNLKDEVQSLSALNFNEDNELSGYFGSGGAVFRVDLQRELNRA